MISEAEAEDALNYLESLRKHALENGADMNLTNGLSEAIRKLLERFIRKDKADE